MVKYLKRLIALMALVSGLALVVTLVHTVATCVIILAELIRWILGSSLNLLYMTLVGMDKWIYSGIRNVLSVMGMNLDSTFVDRDWETKMSQVSTG